MSKTCHFIGSSGIVTYMGLPPNRRRPFNFTVQATGPNGESLTIFRTFRTGLSFVPTDREGTEKCIGCCQYSSTLGRDLFPLSELHFTLYLMP